MSWTTPKTWNFKEYPSSSDFNTYIRDNMNALRDGTGWDTNVITLGYSEVTTPQGSITTTADLTNLAITITVPSGGRKVSVSGSINAYSTVADGLGQITINEGATVLQRSYFSPTTAGIHYSIEVVLSPSAGSHTYKFTLGRDSGSGTYTMYAGATFPAFIIAKLI